MTSRFNPKWVCARLFRRTAGRERGASLVEVVLLMPLLMLILFGMMDLGRYIFLAMEVSGAARSGAQYGSQSASTSTDTTGIQTAARNDVMPDVSSGLGVTSSITCWCLNNPGHTVTCGSACSSGNQIDLLQVNTSLTYTPWFPYPPFRGTYTINGTAVIPVAQQF